MSVSIAPFDKNPTRFRLQIQSGAGYWITNITRVDESGTHTVRAESGVFPTAANAGPLVISDYEYPLTFKAPYSYTVYATNGTATQSATLLIDAAHALFNTQRGLLQITVPLRPDSGLQLNDGEEFQGSVIVRWENDRPSRHTVHAVVGREDPVVVLQRAASRTGTMDIDCPSLRIAQTLEKTLAQPYVFQLRQSDQWTLAVYFVPVSVRVTHSENDWTDGENPERRWTVTVELMEVAWPAGYVVPITVWTWNDVVAGYGDWNAVTASFATWADLLERQPI